MSDSDESEGEAGLGNVNRLIVRPAGQSGKAKRGQLCFDAAFECGNLGRIDHVSDIEYDLHVRPDTCRPRARFWFNFTVENTKQDQRVIFNIVNLGKELTLYNENMTPLVRSSSRMKWVRLPRRHMYCHKSIHHRGHKILSIAFAFDKEEEVYHFTAAAPYSYTRLQKHLSMWEKRAQALATRETIAESTQKRKIDLITIENKTPIVTEDQVQVKSKTPGDQKKRYVVIMARSHGGEPPASFICQGFLDFMISSSEKAAALRNGIVIKVIPMLNPDGVFLGNQRSDLLGADLNRSWDNITKFAHPGLMAATDVVDKLSAESKGVQLDFIIDIHADISHEGVFVRGNTFDDVYRFERHAVLPKFLCNRIEAWRPEACLFNSDPTVAGTARRSLPIGAVDAYSLMASLGGRKLRPIGPYIHYTEDAYLKIGRSIAKALCDYYRHIGVIPPRVSRDKKKEQRGRRRRKRPVTGKERSPSSSPERERRVLPPRVVSPPLPAVSLAVNVLPPRTAKHYRRVARQRLLPDVADLILPIITGTAVRTPRLAIVDMSAYIRTPAGFFTYNTGSRPSRLSRLPRPSHARFTSDEYDTQESD